MYQDKKVCHIVARGLNGEIGANNKLLWNIIEDMVHFKDSTIGHAVVMGRKTSESLPNPLKNRISLVVSTLNYDETDKVFALGDSLSDAVIYSNILNADKFFIIGGSQLYNSTFDIVDELWITQVEKDYHEADAFYQIPDGFTLVEDLYGDRCTDVGYSFQKWVRK